jgi:hypothetical protein
LQARRFNSKTTAMSVPKDELRQAVELALAGKWDAAHELIQQYEDVGTAAWIHAVPSIVYISDEDFLYAN